MKRKLLYVEWVDATGPGDSGWMDNDGLAEFLGRELRIREVGFLVKEDDEYISLVAGLSEEPEDSEWVSHYHRVLKIPQGCVKKRKDITRYIT